MACKVINPSALEVIWTSQGEIIKGQTAITGNIVSGVSDTGINCLFPSTATSNGDYYPTIMQAW